MTLAGPGEETRREAPRADITYSSYLKLDELLALQQPLSAQNPDGAEHDETLFIVIHQVYELWFKQLLHEVDYLNVQLGAGEIPRSLGTLKRILTILKVVVAQIDVLETMTPLDFLSFRERLAGRSGFQSFQFRELEFVLGLKRPEALDRYPKDSVARARLERRLAEPTLWDAFLKALGARYPIPRELLERDVTRPVTPEPALHPFLIEVYRKDSMMSVLCERLVDLDEGIQEWRYRHVKMVQRTIGARQGTGGSEGAPYLMTTLNQPLFPDLWEIRTEF
jgi:tryptophan 2,3-dioxygenase